MSVHRVRQFLYVSVSRVVVYRWAHFIKQLSWWSWPLGVLRVMAESQQYQLSSYWRMRHLCLFWKTEASYVCVSHEYQSHRWLLVREFDPYKTSKLLILHYWVFTMGSWNTPVLGRREATWLGPRMNFWWGNNAQAYASHSCWDTSLLNASTTLTLQVSEPLWNRISVQRTVRIWWLWIFERHSWNFKFSSVYGILATFLLWFSWNGRTTRPIFRNLLS